jgi:catechol 2,3-dioxygenase-like lactoylglutathione lyase family enzyme
MLRAAPDHARKTNKGSSMIGYVTLGTNDMPRAARFYDELLGVVGAKRTTETEKFIAWGSDPATPMLFVIKPADGNKATVGNGVMVAFAAKDEDEVNRIYKKAIALGAKDEGPAGPRGDGFYAGYFRDSDGNKLCAFYSG